MPYPLGMESITAKPKQLIPIQNIYILKPVHTKIPETEMFPLVAYLFTNLPYFAAKPIDQVTL